MTREVFIPDMLESHIQIASADITLARFEDRPKLSETPFSDEETQASLTKFAGDISGQVLNDYMQLFAKDCMITNREFTLKTVFNPRKTDVIEDEGMGEFYLDGDFSLALGIKSHIVPENKTWVGITSFCLGRGVENYIPYGKNHLTDTMPFRYPHPVIVQIQGPSPIAYGREYRRELYYEALSVLQDYKWERALIGLTLDWAREEGIPSVYLLPADKNRWAKSSEQMERLEMRYDVSAKRLGFKLQPNGLYATSVV